MRRRRIARGILIGLVAAVAVAQVVPYGHDHTNPPVTRDATWPSARAAEIAHRACYGCHSNQTVWPWYASVAPASWLVASDVAEGREELNFSEWDRPQKHLRHAAKEVREGDMPPLQYRLVHPEARLSDDDRAALIQALEAMAAGRPESAHPEARGDEDAE